MKKLLTGLLTISSIGLLMLTSCKKNDKMVTDAGSTASTLTVTTTTPVLSSSMINDTATIIRFNFSSPKYTYPGAGQQNEIQVDAAGDNWKNPAATVLTSYSEGFTTFALAKLLIGLQLPAGKQTTVNVRVANQMSAESALYSNVISLTVTPINLASWIYVPGDYEGWGNPGLQEDSLVSASSNGIYTGIIDFRGYAGSTGSLQYKIVPVKGSWTIAYGDAGGGTISTSGGNLTAPTAEPYIVTVDMNKLTITMVAADWYSVIGDVTPGTAWSTDTELKFLNDGSNKWVVNGIAMTAGSPPNDGFKVRQDDQWNNSWGTLATPDGVTLTDASGVNIGTPSAGNYNFSFVMAPSTYGATPPQTTTYTLVKQ